MMNTSLKVALLKVALTCLLGLVGPLTKTAAAEDYTLEEVVNGLDMPWGLAILPDGDMLVSELSGQLRLVRDGELIARPVAGVPETFYAGQGGLMDVRLHPNFATNNLVYLSLAVGSGYANALRVVRGRFDGGQLQDVETVFEAAPAKDTAAHYGGRMTFLPDNTLLVTVGDGFDYREDAQNRANHFGTIVRVSDAGKVPADNPYVDDPAALPEVWSYGHRNAQSIIYDAATDTVFQTEHGPRGGDELNIIAPAKNYGWPAITYGIDYSGLQISPYTSYEGMEQPLKYWDPSFGPSGMTLYRGAAFPNWDGDIFMTSLVFNHVVRVDMDGRVAGSDQVLFGEIGERLRDIRTGPDGALYILSEGTGDSDGRLWRVRATNR
ncbi:MAG: Aldose sugar dehydrogenase YliI [Rhodobiaceae bacterium UBA7378]|nr:MAG: Aldose sugar dehydrogenase YliI [Rhodobiaceae bacterium UBA7378]|tara:strand:- start:1770 stop:2909 length:1140 start_codon:yes stop_codon:yes gene_type:complete